MQSGDDTSLEELKHGSLLLEDCAADFCAPKEKLTIFRKRAVVFGNMPECGHNWARDTGDSNFGRGIFWNCSSDPVIPLFQTLQHGKEPKY